MVRKLRYHEQKLLKKVDFVNWKSDKGVRESSIIRKYYLQRREDYAKYSRLAGRVTSLVAKLRRMEQKDPVRIDLTNRLLQKLYSLGLIPTEKSLVTCEKISVSSFCRRRLPVVMVRLRMAEHLREAVTFVEQGHVRVGPNVVTDPSFVVTRSMEDFVTWVDSSKIKQKLLKYRDQLDDYDLL